MSSTAESISVVQSVLRRVTASAEYARLLEEVKGGARIVSINGLTGGPPARALALAALQRDAGKCFALVTQANRDLEAWERDVRFWYCALRARSECDDTVWTLPSSESDPYAGASPHPETLEQRALTLWQLSRGTQDFVLLTARALARRTLAPEEVLRAGTVLRRDEEQSPEELVERLVASGYMREEPVGAVGEFSIRGGILDVWSPGRNAPVRVEFFGDTVESIREFDPETQLSTAQLKEVAIAPMRELSVTSEDFREWAEAARARWSDERYARALRDRTVFADEGESFTGWEWLMNLVRRRNASIFDYLKTAVLVVDEPAAVENNLGTVYETLATRYAETEAADELGLRPEELYLTPEELRARLETLERLEIRALGRTAAALDQQFAIDAERPEIQLGRARASASQPLFLFPAVEAASEVEWPAQSARRYHGRLPELASDVLRAHKEGRVVTLFVMPSLGMAERVAEMLDDYGVAARLALTSESATASASAEEKGGAIVTVGRISGGFELPSAGLVVHVESDLFDEASEWAIERRGVPCT